MSIRNDVFSRISICFQKHALFDAGEQIFWQGGLEGIARVLDEAMVDVAPMALQIRVHAWKWTFHVVEVTITNYQLPIGNW